MMRHTALVVPGQADKHPSKLACAGQPWLSFFNPLQSTPGPFRIPLKKHDNCTAQCAYITGNELQPKTKFQDAPFSRGGCRSPLMPSTTQVWHVWTCAQCPHRGQNRILCGHA